MNTCPGGYEISEAFRTFKCRTCGFYCIIRYLLNEISNLQSRIDSLE